MLNLPIKFSGRPKKKDQSFDEKEREENFSGPVTADIQKILFATDISETAKFAARYACSIGNKFDAKVWVMHVVKDPLEAQSFQAGMNLSGQMDPEEKQRLDEQALELAKKKVQERIRKTSQKVLEEIPYCPLAQENIIVKTGFPVDEIVREAEQGDFDLIIMGTHGQDGLEDFFLGSTAQGVIRRSKVPVLVARPGFNISWPKKKISKL
jgi:nucleotide-binding universal stress UspA family protein